jgi:hypothetical protein
LARGNVRFVDEGLPIAYEVLERGVSVYASDRNRVGTVDHVVSAPEVDVFHGIVIRSEQGQRFIPADEIASLHERGVDLRLDAVAVRRLSEPAGGAPAWRVREPGVKPSRWSELLDLVTGADKRRESWRKED